MIKFIRQSIMLVCGLWIITSCGSSDIINKVDERVGDKELINKLYLLNEKPYDFFSAKMSVDYTSSALNQSFKTSVKMTVDSAFSGTISYAGFIIANFLADNDSIKATNKQEKCYFTEDFSYISSIIGVELEYNFLESMILAQPIGVDSTVKYKQIKDKDKKFYILASHKKRKYKKIEKDKIDLEDEKNDDIFIQYYFTADSMDLKKMMIEIPVDSVSILINYVETEMEENKRVPEYTTLSIKHPKDSAVIGLSFSRQSVNNRRDHVFSVPDNYENCNK